MVGGGEGAQGGSSGSSRHGFLPRQPPVVERVHVNDLLRLDDGRWLRLLFEAALALQRHAQLVHHGAAERSLHRATGREREREKPLVVPRVGRPRCRQVHLYANLTHTH